MIMQFLSIGLIALFGAMLPGPDFAIVVRNSLFYSRSAGIFTSFGIGAAIIIHMTYCVLGLALVIAHSPFLFSLIKYAGGTYLIYLGIQMLITKQPRLITPMHVQQKPTQLSHFTAFKQGFLCNLLNPKATLFFLSLFTVVIKPDTPLLFQAGIGLEMIVIAIIWFCCLTVILSHPAVKKMLEKAEPIIAKILGLFLIGFGALLALI